MKTARRASLVWGILISIAALAAASEVWSLGPPHFPAELTQGAGIIKDKNWAIVLGKALFWDQQLGSDSQACASCHNVGGADTRLRNQLTPGFTDITFGPNGDKLFGSVRSDTGTVGKGHMPSGAMAGPNYTLTPADMPLHRLLDETNRDSLIITTTNDRVSSQGSYDSTFFRTGPFRIFDRCSEAAGDIFYAGMYPARQVEPRNTPTTINAVYNNRNFWDGRANNTFNGVGVFGKRDLEDPKKRLILLDPMGKPYLGWLELPDSSLASQAVGPPLSEREMSCNGRDFADLGRKMLLKVPLLLQKIHAQDSVLGKPGPFGDLRNITGRGLKLQYLYADLIKKAFDDKYWKLSGFYNITDSGELRKATKATILNGYTQMEHNFSMFYGIAIMMYESTLVSDQSEFDTLVGQGKIKVALGPGPATNTGDLLLDRGAGIFFNPPNVPVFVPGNPAPVSKGAGCLFCHGAPTLSENQVEASTPFTPFLNPVGDVNGVNDIRDLGFANIGIRPVFTDLLVGGTDPYGNPLSYGRQYKNNAIIDLFLQHATTLPPQNPVPGAPPTGGIQTNIFNGPVPVTKLEADGAAKIPTLRNVALTPPYFLWGGYPDLRQALKVYNRGGNRRQVTTNPLDAHDTACVSGDDTGTGPDGDLTYDQLKVGTPDCNTNTTGLMNKLGLSDCDAPAGSAEKNLCIARNQTVDDDDLAALVRLMKSFTDPRVQRDQKPFDHPELFVINGHKPTDNNHDGKADDIIFKLPEVGQDGYDPASGFCIPNAGDLFAPGMQARSGGLKVPLLP